MTRVLLTGASGFIGAAMALALREAGHELRTASRGAGIGDHVRIGDLAAHADWRAALEGVEAVVHLAGPAHARPDAAGVRAIIEGTGALAAQAQVAGVSRFIYLSSIKAGAADDAYARAKQTAEQALGAHAALNPVSLRPPLVHAPDAKANFALLLRLADSGAPLPFAGVDNRRSLIARASVIEAVAAVLAAPQGPAGVFAIADRPALSTGAMIIALRRGLARPARLFNAPALAALAPAVLRESLEADDSAFRATYGYGPRSMADARADLEACAAAWKAGR